MTDNPKARLLALTRATPSATRPAARRRAWLVAPVSFAVGAALFFAFGGPEHGRGRPAWFFAASVASWTAVSAAAMWAALDRGRSSLGRSLAWLAAVAAGTPSALFAIMLGFALEHPEVTRLHPERLGLKCLGIALGCAAFPCVSLILLRRGSDPIHPTASGAALGVACAASAGVVVELWCPVAAPLHVIVGHIVPMAVMCLAGAILGSRVLGLPFAGASTPRP